MRRTGRFLCAVVMGGCFVMIAALTVSAAKKETIYNSAYVTFSPDGKAWTTNAGEQSAEWYAKGTAVSTELASTLRVLKKGEHYYTYERTGEIPIGEWQVIWDKVNCCHNTYLSTTNYHGIAYTKNLCWKSHYSGWNPYCADCGEKITESLIYMSSKAAGTIDYINVGTGMDYYYLCPFCSNLEQGVSLVEHECKAISWNQYKVIYNANTGNLPKSGYMADSYHMYNNAEEYEGEAVTPVTHLTRNGYGCIGYEFVEWNTKPDGSGKSFADGAEIYNLTDVDISEGGQVMLYAQWRSRVCSLQVDPNNGTYKGSGAVFSVEGKYGESYRIEERQLTAPKGYTVSFDTNGGKSVAAITGTRHFTEWTMKSPFRGELKNGSYWFLAPDGNTDVIVANYALDAISLPGATKQGSSFGGWYYDKNCTKLAGGVGDRIIPAKNMTLYALWVDLKLSAENSSTANGGKGAVDLSWSQADKNQKTYKIYQSRDNATWELITAADDIGNQSSVEKNFVYSGSSKTYTVPYSGIYTLTAEGAQGGNYGKYDGGYGGSVSVRMWLKAGEKLTYTIGGRKGYNGGGEGSDYGNGGGATTVISDLQGTIMIAGGGGGAGKNSNGGDGGSKAGIREDKKGEGVSGQAGGGAGYVGGNAGSYVIHTHVEPQEGKTSSCRHIHGEKCYIYHEHSGSVESGGSCYKYDYTQYDYSQWHCGSCSHWGGVYMGSLGYCTECGSSSIGPKETPVYKLSCKKTETTVEDYRCDRDEDYFCGYSQGEIISSKKAYGGSNYVNTTIVYEYSQNAGVRKGNGTFSISSDQVGYLDMLTLEDVVATDFTAPDSISMETVTREALSERQIKVSWQKPEDKGTDYFHKAESYKKGNAAVLCQSNITKNTLISGIKGYYVLVDKNEAVNVTAANGSFQTVAGKSITIGDAPQYLHVAAVDKAGNIGKTEHIKVGALDVAWEICTERLELTAGDNVYPAEADNHWYVRADGSTPFTMRHYSYIKGPASNGYQPNYCIYEATAEGKVARNIVYTPAVEVQSGSVRTDANQLFCSVEGECPLLQYPYSYTVRTEQNRRLEGVQAFVLQKEDAGKRIAVIPIAGAEQGDTIIYSDYTADQKHGITLIGDGEGPVITGMEALKTIAVIDRNAGNITLNVTAVDLLSGVKEFYLKITNQDNFSSRIYEPDSEGHIRVEVTRDEPIFTGDLEVYAYAVDFVGNETEVAFETTEFALSAEIERILEPHDSIFKCGESGLLTITAQGYAEKIEVIFPEEMTAICPELNRVFVYTGNESYMQQETIQFMIPLHTTADAQYIVTVRAYKGDRRLEEHPTFSTVSVEGSVLDELRTRLR